MDKCEMFPEYLTFLTEFYNNSFPNLQFMISFQRWTGLFILKMIEHIFCY